MPTSWSEGMSLASVVEAGLSSNSTDSMYSLVFRELVISLTKLWVRVQSV